MDNPDQLPQPADEAAVDYREAARIRSLEEGAGYSPALARAAVSGATGELFPSPRQATEPAKSHLVPRTSRRGGRSYPEPTARDAEAAQRYEQPTAEQIADRQRTTAAGMQTVERRMGAHNFERDVATAQRLGISVETATQLRLDKRARARRERQGQ